MKTTQATLAAAWLTASLALAVPSEINYQGVLTDSQGNLVNGNQTMSLKIYDSSTGGTLLYSEDLGTVPVNNGVYNFTFGANGTSNALTTETVATTNGTASTFQKVLSASTVVAGSVTVTDGNYTWDQTNGSSNENDFGVAYSTALRRVTATYYNGAPATGRTITATYRTPASGISTALAGDSQPWAEISVNGTVQTPRQKVLMVPFAAKAYSVNISDVKGMQTTQVIRISWLQNQNPTSNFRPQPIFELPLATATESSRWHGQFFTQIPYYVRKINSVNFTAKSLGSTLGYVNIEIKQGSTSLFTSATTLPVSPGSYSIPVNLNIDPLSPTIMYVTVSPAGNNQYPYFSGLGAQIDLLTINAEVVIP
jgi:hypothetical protein